jgi:hypothetical protein
VTLVDERIAEAADLTRRTRPLQLGLSIGHPRGTVGSIGPFVWLSDGRVGFVSAGFVLAPEGAHLGDYIHQPGPVDVEILTGASRVGRLERLVRARPKLTNTVDAALVLISDRQQTAGNVAPASTPDAGRTISTVAADVSPGDVVAFVGRTTGFAEGRIRGIEFHNVVIQVERNALTFKNLIEVEPAAPGTLFCQPGDSGALVWRRSDMAALGLVFAAAMLEKGDGQLAYVMPIDRVLSALDVMLM